MRTHGRPDVVVVAEGLDGPRLEAVRPLVAAFATHGHAVDVVVPRSRAMPRRPERELVGRGGARHVLVRDLFLEAAGLRPGAPPWRARWRRDRGDALADVRATRDDVVELPAVLTRRLQARRPGPVVVPWTLAAGRTVLVRERTDTEDRPFQRDYLDHAGTVRVVTWVDRDSDVVTTVLDLDHGEGVARRTRVHRWTARRLASEPPVPVVAATAWGDEVIDVLPMARRALAVRHGADLGPLTQALADGGRNA
ncbi:hypothetical protein [Isoptericola sp. NPDC019482]|uniref:hypothetical protein n=1 Tax=Isoptericola sp. NPDC019482 TaxID=3154688 RepID=UPI00348108FD